MTGRGDGRLIRPSSHPSVTVGLTLSLSSATLSSSSPSPLYVIVTARILATPRPTCPITLQAHPTGLSKLSNRSFNNIVCSSNPSKQIEIFPRGWPQYHFNSENLRAAWDFVTVPAQSQGSVLVVSHEVPRERILAAGLVPGERYSVSLTDKCLGAKWWAFKGQEELEGVRLATWQPEEDAVRGRDKQKEIMKEIDRGEWPEHHAKEWMEMNQFKEGPVDMGEEPNKLAMVRENDFVEFEVV